jgi:hypothetical protein
VVQWPEVTQVVGGDAAMLSARERQDLWMRLMVASLRRTLSGWLM